MEQFDGVGVPVLIKRDAVVETLCLGQVRWGQVFNEFPDRAAAQEKEQDDGRKNEQAKPKAAGAQERQGEGYGSS